MAEQVAFQSSLGKVHLDEDVAGKDLAGGRALLAVLDVDDFLARHLDVGDDVPGEVAVVDHHADRPLDLVLVAGVDVENVPGLGHALPDPRRGG